MSTEPMNSSLTTETSAIDYLTLARWAFILAAISFFIGGAIVIRTEVPPSLSPMLGMLSHALWALAIVFLALGAVVLLRSTEMLRVGLAGYLAAGVLGLGVLQSLQWATWAYVDVRAARVVEHELVLETLIVPYGAGHLIGYGLLVGTGIALLGWALRRTDLTHRYLPGSGVILGIVTVLFWIITLLFAMGGGDDGHVLFDIATIFIPVLYLWGLILGISIIRSEPSTED